MKQCILYDRVCTGCGECDLCDLTPGKVCDNCGKCIQTEGHFKSIKIDKIILPKNQKDGSGK